MSKNPMKQPMRKSEDKKRKHGDMSTSQSVEKRKVSAEGFTWEMVKTWLVENGRSLSRGQTKEIEELIEKAGGDGNLKQQRREIVWKTPSNEWIETCADEDIKNLWSPYGEVDDSVIATWLVLMLKMEDKNHKWGSIVSNDMNTYPEDFSLLDEWTDRWWRVVKYLAVVNIDQKHWVLAVFDTVKKTTDIYDSASNAYPKERIARNVDFVARKMLFYEDDIINVKFREVPQQTGNKSCGVLCMYMARAILKSEGMTIAYERFNEMKFRVEVAIDLLRLQRPSKGVLTTTVVDIGAALKRELVQKIQESYLQVKKRREESATAKPIIAVTPAATTSFLPEALKKQVLAKESSSGTSTAITLGGKSSGSSKMIVSPSQVKDSFTVPIPTVSTDVIKKYQNLGEYAPLSRAILKKVSDYDGSFDAVAKLRYLVSCHSSKKNDKWVTGWNEIATKFKRISGRDLQSAWRSSNLRMKVPGKWRDKMQACVVLTKLQEDPTSVAKMIPSVVTQITKQVWEQAFDHTIKVLKPKYDEALAEIARLEKKLNDNSALSPSDQLLLENTIQEKESMEVEVLGQKEAIETKQMENMEKEATTRSAIQQVSKLFDVKGSCVGSKEELKKHLGELQSELDKVIEDRERYKKAQNHYRAIAEKFKIQASVAKEIPIPISFGKGPQTHRDLMERIEHLRKQDAKFAVKINTAGNLSMEDAVKIMGVRKELNDLLAKRSDIQEHYCQKLRQKTNENPYLFEKFFKTSDLKGKSYEQYLYEEGPVLLRFKDMYTAVEDVMSCVGEIVLEDITLDKEKKERMDRFLYSHIKSEKNLTYYNDLLREVFGGDHQMDTICKVNATIMVVKEKAFRMKYDTMEDVIKMVAGVSAAKFTNMFYGVTDRISKFFLKNIRPKMNKANMFFRRHLKLMNVVKDEAIRKREHLAHYEEYRSVYDEILQKQMKQESVVVFKKLFVILRGISGSGKTTFAECIQLYHSCEEIVDNDQMVYTLSVEDYFGEHKGNYFFKLSNMKKAREECFKEAKGLMESQIPRIILDDDNIKLEDYEEYKKIAGKNGYKLIVIQIKVAGPDQLEVCCKRAVNNVPKKNIVEQLQNMDVDSTEKTISLKQSK